MRRRTRSFRILLLAIALPILAGCGGGGESEDGVTTIVFKHFKVPGGEESMRALVDRFEEENPGIRVVDELLPASTDQQHQFYVTNLEAGSDDFDVFALDVIWTPEFSRAGWLLDLSDLYPEEERQDFLAGPLRANTWNDKLWAVPWYVDGGVLYYRRDLLEKHSIPPPETFAELSASVKAIQAKENDDDLHGFIWQGKQYEGLVCVAMEFIHGNGAGVIEGERSVIDSPRAIEAVATMRSLIEEGVTPPMVTTADEEATRNTFGGGRAIYMRNWPYAWNIFQEEGSAVRGNVGIVPMPHFPGAESASTLGGWQLGVNVHSEHPEAARTFIQFMTSPEVQKDLAISAGFKPSRRSVYSHPALMEAQPFIVDLLEVMQRTQPRPVTPYYPRITQVLQIELSAVVSGIKEPAEAMRSAKEQIDEILALERG